MLVDIKSLGLRDEEQWYGQKGGGGGGGGKVHRPRPSIGKDVNILKDA